MYLGKMVETAAYDQLYEKRYHPYTEALLSAIPQVGEEAGKHRIHLEGEVPSLPIRRQAVVFIPAARRPVNAVGRKYRN